MRGLGPKPAQTHFMFKTMIALWNQNNILGLGLKLLKLKHLQSFYEKSLHESLVIQSIFLNFKGLSSSPQLHPPPQVAGVQVKQGKKRGL